MTLSRATGSGAIPTAGSRKQEQMKNVKMRDRAFCNHMIADYWGAREGKSIEVNLNGSMVFSNEICSDLVWFSKEGVSTPREGGARAREGRQSATGAAIILT